MPRKGWPKSAGYSRVVWFGSRSVSQVKHLTTREKVTFTSRPTNAVMQNVLDVERHDMTDTILAKLAALKATPQNAEKSGEPR